MYVAFQLACVPSLGGLHRRTWLARRAGRLETPWPAPTGRTGVPDHLGCHRLHRARHFCGQPQHRPPTLAHARSRRPPGPTPIRQPLPDASPWLAGIAVPHPRWPASATSAPAHTCTDPSARPPVPQKSCRPRCDVLRDEYKVRHPRYARDSQPVRLDMRHALLSLVAAC